ncbi:substrate-binding periplasmic protein [Shewanella waksmanii]|uniref:substrate-binding periplasmic protein n=1 Tax=Shewanella waksmanii TaxID=213783 RepID=UPI003736BE4E
MTTDCVRLYILLIFFSLLMLSPQAYAESKSLLIVSSEGPPHTIDGDPHGIDLDVVASVLRRLGYTVSFQFMALNRASREVIKGRADVAAPIFDGVDMHNYYLSAPIVHYKPMVFSLKRAKLNVTKISDLQGHSLVTFQGAPGYFGAEFAKLATGGYYKELTEMAMIPELLAKGRYEFAVLDRDIFYYFYRLENKRRDLTLFDEHAIIPPVTASAVFKDPKLRDAFNKELVLFLQTPQYQQIYEHYLGVTPYRGQVSQ